MLNLVVGSFHSQVVTLRYTGKGVAKMDVLRSLSMSPSIAARAQKIRERMMIEQLSGVSPSNKDIFLSFCQRYEQQSLGAGVVVCNEADPTQNNMKHQWIYHQGDCLMILFVVAPCSFLPLDPFEKKNLT